MLASIAKKTMGEVTGAEARNRLFRALTEATQNSVRTELPREFGRVEGVVSHVYVNDLRVLSGASSQMRFKAEVTQLHMHGKKPLLATRSMIEGVFDALTDTMTRFRQWVHPGI